MQKIAVLFALAGVTWIAIDYGKIPWISLFLAFSFGFYGLLRKVANLQSLPGLLIETMLLMPIALFYLFAIKPEGSTILFHYSAQTIALLIIAGPVTAIPLFLFGVAATRIPLSTIGFIQYFSPTLQLLIGLFVYNEPFNKVHLISFSLVWIGLIIYTISLLRLSNKKRAK